MTKEDYYPKCTKFGKHHGAYFQEIKRMGTKYVGGEEVVRWCSECGAITIDFEEYRSEEHTSELQSHSFISYAVFCLKKKKKYNHIIFHNNTYLT